MSSSRWFNAPWSTVWRPERIALKELVPVVVAAAVWGREWSGSAVLLESDNSTVVAAVNLGTSRDATLMPLLRSLQFIKAAFSFTLRARHLPGKLNHVADALSRGHAVTDIKRFCQQIAEESFPVPQRYGSCWNRGGSTGYSRTGDRSLGICCAWRCRLHSPGVPNRGASLCPFLLPAGTDAVACV